MGVVIGGKSSNMGAPSGGKKEFAFSRAVTGTSRPHTQARALTHGTHANTHTDTKNESSLRKRHGKQEERWAEEVVMAFAALRPHATQMWQ